MTTLRTHIDLPYIRDVRRADVRRACYTPERLAELYDRPHTVVEVLLRRDGKWHDVPDADRLWTVLRLDLIDARTLRLFACDCAERTLDRRRAAGREPDPRSMEAVRVARLYADGKATADELGAAHAASCDAAARAVAAAHAKDAYACADVYCDTTTYADAADAAIRSANTADAGGTLTYAPPGAVAERRWQVEHLAAMLGTGGAS